MILQDYIGFFFLKFKSKVARVFWKFKKMVENQSGCKIQVLRSDNEKEYASKEFNLFSEQASIEHQFTTPYTPQQNGVSEKRNIYIMEMTRCMLHDKELPKKFWAGAISIVVFLQNRLPTKALKNKTPFEAWYSYKPSFNFLKVFDCVCFSLTFHKSNMLNLTKSQNQTSSWDIVPPLKPTRCINLKQGS